MLTVSGWILTTLIGALGFGACTKNIDYSVDEYGCSHAKYSVKGKVVNNLDLPIPGIQIEIYYSPTPQPSTLFPPSVVKTDSNGNFSKSYGLRPADINLTLKVTDIDGLLNVLYKSASQEVPMKMSELKGKSGMWYEGSVEKEVKIVLQKDDKQ